AVGPAAPGGPGRGGDRHGRDAARRRPVAGAVRRRGPRPPDDGDQRVGVHERRGGRAGAGGEGARPRRRPADRAGVAVLRAGRRAHQQRPAWHGDQGRPAAGQRGGDVPPRPVRRADLPGGGGERRAGGEDGGAAAEGRPAAGAAGAADRHRRGPAGAAAPAAAGAAGPEAAAASVVRLEVTHGGRKTAGVGFVAGEPGVIVTASHVLGLAGEFLAPQPGASRAGPPDAVAVVLRPGTPAEATVPARLLAVDRDAG